MRPDTVFYTIVAAFEAVDEGRIVYPAVASYLPNTPTLNAILAFTPGVLLVLVFVAWIVRVMLGRPRRRIEILTPGEGATVGLHHDLAGAIFPSGAPVQLLVYSGDNRWWPQAAADVSDNHWSASCQFGTEKDGHGDPFKVVARSASLPILEPRRHLPWFGKRSRLVTVKRSH